MTARDHEHDDPSRPWWPVRVAVLPLLAVVALAWACEAAAGWWERRW